MIFQRICGFVVAIAVAVTRRERRLRTIVVVSALSAICVWAGTALAVTYYWGAKFTTPPPVAVSLGSGWMVGSNSGGSHGSIYAWTGSPATWTLEDSANQYQKVTTDLNGNPWLLHYSASECTGGGGYAWHGTLSGGTWTFSGLDTSTCIAAVAAGVACIQSTCTDSQVYAIDLNSNVLKWNSSNGTWSTFATGFVNLREIAVFHDLACGGTGTHIPWVLDNGTTLYEYKWNALCQARGFQSVSPAQTSGLSHLSVQYTLYDQSPTGAAGAYKWNESTASWSQEVTTPCPNAGYGSGCTVQYDNFLFGSDVGGIWCASRYNTAPNCNSVYEYEEGQNMSPGGP